MPIGVPKVEYRLPGEPEADWLDLYNCLYRERMLFLCQDLGDEVANQLISLMLYLNAEDPSLPFFMYINSLGGSVTCGIGVFDIMRYLHSGITTICMGTASSMASFVLAGGTYGRRLSLPHGRIMIHQPEGGSDGQASEILSESTEVSRIRRQIGLLYAIRTQQTVEQIARDMDRDQFMSADEAKSYGLIDFVARPAGESALDDSAALEAFIKASDPAGTLNKLATAGSVEDTQDVIREIPQTDDHEPLDATATFFTAPQLNSTDSLQDVAYTGLLSSPPQDETTQNPIETAVMQAFVGTTQNSETRTSTDNKGLDGSIRETLQALGASEDEDITLSELENILDEITDESVDTFIPWTQVLGDTELDLPEIYALGESDASAEKGQQKSGSVGRVDVTFESMDESAEWSDDLGNETVPLFNNGLLVDE